MNISTILIKALTTTLLGMGTVFVLLIVISLIIGWLKYIPLLLQKLQGSEQTACKKAEAHPSLDEISDDTAAKAPEKLAAVITAAICAYEAEHGQAAGGDDYVVRSIRRIRH